MGGTTSRPAPEGGLSIGGPLQSSLLGVSTPDDKGRAIPAYVLGEEQRKSLSEIWKRLSRKRVSYPGGVYPDNTKYLGGERLIIGDEQIMDTFERRWCEATVDAMFEGKSGQLNVLERGFGLGLMSEFILRQMAARGGNYFIVELNAQVHKDAQKWADASQHWVDQRRIPLKITVLNEDADVALLQFPEQYFDLIFSDTHQLRDEDRGINDLLAVECVKSRLKPDGHFTFCAFHKGNQKGDVDPRQDRLISPHFRYSVDSVEVIVPADCTYLEGPKIRLPVVVCEMPRY